jgi:hypothetical protein
VRKVHPTERLFSNSDLVKFAQTILQLRPILSQLLLLAALQNCLFGQDKSSDLAATFGQRVSSLFSRPTKGSPLQAQFEEKYFRKIPQAKESRQSMLGRAYRDVEGRIRKDFEHQVSLNLTVKASVIYDPTTNIVYALDHASRTVTKTKFPGVPTDRLLISPTETPLDIYATVNQVGRDDLGEREVEGFVCHGHRLQIRSKASAAQYTVELWISNLINEVLWERKTNDVEEDMFRLFNIERTQPANTLFSVPSDYREVN